MSIFPFQQLSPKSLLICEAPRCMTFPHVQVKDDLMCCVAGMWAQSVLHPSAGLTKEYVVTCSEEPTRRQLETIAAGCEVDGAFVTPVAVAPVKEPGQKNRLRVVISEGRNREVHSSALQSAQPLDCFRLKAAAVFLHLTSTAAKRMKLDFPRTPGECMHSEALDSEATALLAENRVVVSGMMC